LLVFFARRGKQLGGSTKSDGTNTFERPNDGPSRAQDRTDDAGDRHHTNGPTRQTKGTLKYQSRLGRSIWRCLERLQTTGDAPRTRNFNRHRTRKDPTQVLKSRPAPSKNPARSMHDDLVFLVFFRRLRRKRIRSESFAHQLVPIMCAQCAIRQTVKKRRSQKQASRLSTGPAVSPRLGPCPDFRRPTRNCRCLCVSRKTTPELCA
jgi:hypothetical protein